jgi:hypothetical protein
VAADQDAVVEVLSDPDNAYRTAEQVAELVLEALARTRRRPWRYIVLAQNRSPKFYDLRMRFGTYRRRFFPTYAKGPFVTKAEAAQAANRERRKHPQVHVMTALVFAPDDDVDPDKLEEVSA